MSRCYSWLSASAAILSLILSLPSAQAQLPSAQTLQQLQQLPAAEQQRLARQLGIELPALAGNSPAPLAQPVVGSSELPQRTDGAPAVTGLAQESSAPAVAVQPARFGRALFDRTVSTFAATDNNSVPDSYRLGVGDELVVQLYGKESDTLNLQIGRNGQVVAPKLGPLALAGLTFEAARALLLQRVSEQLIGVEAVVSMGRLRAINIFMAGEVAVPGAFAVSALTTVTQALFQAGGVSDIGSLRHIQIKRDGETVGSFDSYDLLLRGDASGDLRLRSGDVVFVPPYEALAQVSGAVKRPMLYELKGYETVDDLVAMAGGLTREAFTGMATLSRIDVASGLPTIETVAIGQRQIGSGAVRNGDHLRVLESGGDLSNVVTVVGAAYRTGEFGWRPGLRVSDLIGDAHRDLLPIADLDYALISSVANLQMDIELTQLSLAQALAAPGSEHDPVLRPRDVLYVFALPGLKEQDAQAGQQRAEQPVESQQQFSRQTLLKPILEKLNRQARLGEPVATVSISGAVRAPGTYPYFAEATLADLVFAGGGLTQSAYVQVAELRRLEVSADGSVEADYRQINLAQELAAQTLTLRSRDHLAVRDIPHWNPVDAVQVEGEVRFPGTYLIEKGETLADLIGRAGGPTAEAFLPGAALTRETIAAKEREQARNFARVIEKTYAASLLTEESRDQSLAEIQAMAEQLQRFEGEGRLLIDLEAILAGNSASDVELLDGDRLVIPKALTTVTVVGEVQQPGSYRHDGNARLDDYLALSAGITKRADAKAIYIVKANGAVRPLRSGLFKARRAKLEAGDTIVVPVDSAYKESLTAWREITQIFYQSAVSLAAVLAL